MRPMKTSFNNLSENLKQQALKKIVAFNNGINLPIFVTCVNDIVQSIEQGYNIDKHFKFEIVGKDVNFSLHKGVKTLEFSV
jgi:hypothetical protein